MANLTSFPIALSKQWQIRTRTLGGHLCCRRRYTIAGNIFDFRNPMPNLAIVCFANYYSTSHWWESSLIPIYADKQVQACVIFCLSCSDDSFKNQGINLAGIGRTEHKKKGSWCLVYVMGIVSFCRQLMNSDHVNCSFGILLILVRRRFYYRSSNIILSAPLCVKILNEWYQLPTAHNYLSYLEKLRHLLPIELVYFFIWLFCIVV